MIACCAWWRVFPALPVPQPNEELPWAIWHCLQLQINTIWVRHLVNKYVQYSLFPYTIYVIQLYNVSTYTSHPHCPTYQSWELHPRSPPWPRTFSTVSILPRGLSPQLMSPINGSVRLTCLPAQQGAGASRLCNSAFANRDRSVTGHIHRQPRKVWVVRHRSGLSVDCWTWFLDQI